MAENHVPWPNSKQPGLPNPTSKAGEPDVLATRCIEADLYAILLHGDAETIGLDQARILLAALKTLSENDPYFAFEDWGRHRASGLMRLELKDDILAIIDSPDRNLQLSVLVLDSMAGTSLARELADVLETIVFDQDRSFDERSCAADALCVSQTVDDFEEVIHRLLDRGGPDSAALACQVLADVGLHNMPIRTGVDTILAHLGITANEVHGWAAIEVREIPVGMFDGLDVHRLGCLLDHIGATIRPLTPLPNHAAESEISDLVRLLTLRFLEADPAMEPARLWKWIGWLNGTSGYAHDTTKRLAHLLGEEQALRAALLEHVVLTPCAENAWMAAHCLNETHLGLFPTHEEVATLLRASRARAGDGPIEIDTWRDLLRLGATPSGPPDLIRDAAVEAAAGNRELLIVLDEMSQVREPEWRAWQQQRDARLEDNRRTFVQAHRSHFAGNLHEVAKGNAEVLSVPAWVYLGCHAMFDRSASPKARLRELLSDELIDQGLAGFIAVLRRSDLPSAADIARAHARQHFPAVEVPMICGVAEMIRQGCTLDALNRDALAAVYMVWQRTPESGARGLDDIGPILEATLFADERDVELHFRTCIEPQLEAKADHVYGLHRLTHDPRWQSLAGRLTVEWWPASPTCFTTFRPSSCHARPSTVPATCCLDSSTTGRRMKPPTPRRRCPGCRWRTLTISSATAYISRNVPPISAT